MSRRLALLSLLALALGCLGCPERAQPEAAFAEAPVRLTLTGADGQEHVYPLADLHFWSNSQPSIQLVTARPSSDPDQPQAQFTGSFPADVVQDGGWVDIAQLQGEALRIEPEAADGAPQGQVAFPPGSDPRAVLGGSLTLTELGERQTSELELEDRREIEYSWPVTAEVVLVLAGVGEGAQPVELRGRLQGTASSVQLR